MTGSSLSTDHLKTKKSILLRVPRLYENDATSVDVLTQAAMLADRGWQVAVYAKSAPAKISAQLIAKKEAIEWARNPATIVMTHYCGFDRELLEFRGAANGKFLLRYHNITPAKWLIPYSLRGATYSLLGKAQISAMIAGRQFDYIFGCSQFNLNELMGPSNLVTNGKHQVLPVFMNYGKFVRSNRDRTKGQPSEVNAVYIGRMAPNKGLHYLPRILDVWNRSHPTIALKITACGRVPPEFKRYFAQVKRTAEQLGVTKQLDFRFDLSSDELTHTLCASDMLLMTSEHEGFGVPLVEAQLTGIPIIALDRAAVRETAGNGAVFLSENPVSYPQVVEAIKSVTSDQALREKLILDGLENAKRFDPERLVDVLSKSLCDIAGYSSEPS